MSFFEPPPPPPEPPRPMPLPEWVGPPDNVLGGVVALGLVAARSEEAAVRLESATAYPNGVQFRIDVRWRDQERSLGIGGAPWDRMPEAGGGLPDELFRAGFQLANGSKATWLGPGGGSVATAVRVDQRPKGPVLTAGEGGGGSHRWTQSLWLWPLPPEGTLEFVCEWPALGIELTRAELESSQIRYAARRSQTLWQRDKRVSRRR